ncbi:MAG: hypothetical protein A3J46_02745 [Candidatus Yanofskybacteria bacterium RIFCSPHIGHO2_02_FULL_41_11]|uniref:Serine protease n=1 Tax=Candidatus Yanofskybacteria bacterium RIFCSPHIGHO2_02_FULL_41_11 TaxID=1802675 RepID=A0A1F8F969_9BACT|nr:MAG: hypothetical protein A3J46_02745 [Candidatus Yanofskybacteria bacterium RIFCSPHIGHO2_02_FULL_41_11]
MKTFFYGFGGGIVALFLIFSLPWGGTIAFNLIRGNLVEFLGTKPEPTPTPIITSDDFWQKIVSDHNLSTVAVQSFKNGKIIREGSGIVVSSDGIIITTFDIISGTDVIQVFHQDKILRAQVVRYDSFKNLALLKVDNSNMDVSRLDSAYQFQSGKDVIISGRLVELSNAVVFAQRGIISHVLSKDIVLNTEPNYFLSGSKVINDSGIVVGMSYLRNESVRLIAAKTMGDFLRSYFESV